MSDLEGMDAFNTVLDRLLEAERNAGALRDERDKAQAAQRDAESEVRRLQGIISTYRAREAQDDEVHAVLKGAHRHLNAVGSIPGLSDPTELLARLKKAVEDTNPIPF